jgi:hypothetical protein
MSGVKEAGDICSRLAMARQGRGLGGSVPASANLEANADVELAGGGRGDFSSYRDVPQYRLRDGTRL